MKPILIFLSLFSFQFSFGQQYFGVKIAPGIQTTTYNSGIEYNPTFSLRSGLHYGYRFNEEKPLGIQSGVYYNQRGYRINDLTLQHSPGNIQRADVIIRQNNIGLNFLLKAEHNFIYASAGPCIEYSLNRAFITDYELESLADGKSTSSPNDFSEAFHFGYEVNLGMQFALSDKIQAFTELSINQVFSQKFETIDQRVGYLNMNLAFGVNYHL